MSRRRNRIKQGRASQRAAARQQREWRQWVEGNLEAAEPLVKSAVSAPKDEPRKLIPALLGWGAYNGITELRKASGLTLEILEAMGDTDFGRIPVSTRTPQLQQYSRPPRNERDNAFRVRMRRLDDQPTAQDQKRMDDIQDKLFAGGRRSRHPVHRGWGVWGPGYLKCALSLAEQVAQLLAQSLPLDAAAWWFVSGRDPDRFPWVYSEVLDATRVRFAQQQVPEKYIPVGAERAFQPYEPQINKALLDPELVLLDSENRPVQEFAFGEVCYWVRNPRSRWYVGRYGWSELESLINVLTGLRNAESYNVSYFTDDHVPPAIGIVSGDFAGDAAVLWLNNFMSTLTNLVGGQGSRKYRFPFLVSPPGTDFKYFPMRDYQQDDMKMREFSLFFLNLFLQAYGIAAEEINFQAYLTRGGQQSGTGGAERVEVSQSITLWRLVDEIERILNTYCVGRLYADPDTGYGPYVVRAQGVRREDERIEQEMAVERLQSGLSTANEERAKRDDPPYRDPVNKKLWQTIERKALQLKPELRHQPHRLGELVCKVYLDHGGELRDWPDMPANPTMVMMRQQEQEGQGGPMEPPLAYDKDGREDLGVSMGLPPGMLTGPLPEKPERPRPKPQTPMAIEKSIRDTVEVVI